MMATVFDFSQDNPISHGRLLRSERESATLTLAQAAAAIGISPITLDGWEQGRKPQLTPSAAKKAYRQFRNDTNHCFKTGNNLFFGVFPIRIAKDILGLSVEQMAAKSGYSVSSWTKMEANARLVPPTKVAEIEGWVSSAWNAACGGRGGE
jgi:DNA-binding XRE family transcriptional regulator